MFQLVSGHVVKSQKMRLTISLEHRFSRTPDGAVWTPTVHAYSFWLRYLDVFDHVRVVARVCDVGDIDRQWVRADGPGVSFHAVPYFVGPKECIQSYIQVRRAIRSAVTEAEAVIMRVPSIVSIPATDELRRRNQPFGLEVVGDPYDVFAPGGVGHPLRPFFRSLFTRTLRRQCRDAKAVAYVTAHALQKRYPARSTTAGISDVILPETAFATFYSSVEIGPAHILNPSRRRVPDRGRAVLVFVGSLEQMYKAPDVLLAAMAKVVARGCDLRLRIVGGGKYQDELCGMAERLGIRNRCEFLGQLPSGAAVQGVLDDSDMFVLPSRVEGLPRAMIEAMARGLPCIGSNIGGIPELLEPEHLVMPGDIDDLSSAIERIVNDPEEQKRMSDRNVSEARKYLDAVLRAKRIEFYKQVKEISREWLKHSRN